MWLVGGEVSISRKGRSCPTVRFSLQSIKYILLRHVHNIIDSSHANHECSVRTRIQGRAMGAKLIRSSKILPLLCLPPTALAAGYKSTALPFPRHARTHFTCHLRLSLTGLRSEVCEH